MVAACVPDHRVDEVPSDHQHAVHGTEVAMAADVS
jgi:hypothetical protein